MCETVDSVDSVDGQGRQGAAPAGVEEQIVSLWAVVEGLRQEMIELRMDKRKVLLEELAMHENQLVEQGVIRERTRAPRHQKAQSPAGGEAGL